MLNARGCVRFNYIVKMTKDALMTPEQISFDLFIISHNAPGLGLRGPTVLRYRLEYIIYRHCILYLKNNSKLDKHKHTEINRGLLKRELTKQ